MLRLVGPRSFRSLNRTTMPNCGHCGQNTIGLLAKWWSFESAPARCRACGGQSYVARAGTSTLYAVVMTVVPCGAVIASIFAASFWPLIIGAALMVSFLVADAVKFLRLPMLPTVASEVAEASRAERLGLAILLCAGVAVVIAYWVHRAV
jgi:hypothetical protein